ncbi:hypothetical protein [Corynebacterium macginleyi]|uniref:hypothetical protein n=1 Tax=Corynebacterium macginleyi TaxID=38290 RepID=UPI0030845028
MQRHLVIHRLVFLRSRRNPAATTLETMTFLDIPEHLSAHVHTLRARPVAALPGASLTVASRTSIALKRAVAQWSTTQRRSDATVSERLRSLHDFIDHSHALDSSLAASLEQPR